MAISNLQAAILDPKPLRDDSVLVTLFLLGFFEVIYPLYLPDVLPSRLQTCTTL